MTLGDLCHRYLDALNTGDPAGAEIVSPLYGVRPARDFYAELFADTSRSETTLLDNFDRSTEDRSVAPPFP